MPAEPEPRRRGGEAIAVSRTMITSSVRDWTRTALASKSTVKCHSLGAR